MYRNIMITMILGGLWHGAGWTFICWGALHGAGQCAGHYRRGRRIAKGLPAQSDNPLAQAWQRFATFNLVCLGWIFFNASTINDAFTLIGRLFTTWGQPAPLVRLPVVAAIVGSLALQYVPRNLSLRAEEVFARLGTAAKAGVLALALLLITTLGPPGVAPFIYFKF
jgi:D-alanyl-lipoteichoic acid acyltransferase DltB (MBOAT superfamily)